jgi:hypothetical protein
MLPPDIRGAKVERNRHEALARGNSEACIDSGDIATTLPPTRRMETQVGVYPNGCQPKSALMLHVVDISSRSGLINGCRTGGWLTCLIRYSGRWCAFSSSPAKAKGWVLQSCCIASAGPSRNLY